MRTDYFVFLKSGGNVALNAAWRHPEATFAEREAQVVKLVYTLL